jgi:hypothetical protein
MIKSKLYSKNSKNLIITSSGFVNPNLYGDLGKILTSHIPISGKFAILDIIKLAEKKYENIYITIDRNVPNLINILKLITKARVIVGESQLNLNSNLKIIFEQLPDNLVNTDLLFGDSLYTDLIIKNDKNKDAIYVSNSIHSTQFTSISREKLTGALSFLDENYVNTNPKVTGSFKISNLKRFQEIFNANLEAKNSDAFWKTWIDYDAELKHKISLPIDSNWTDIGHIDNYFKARRDSIIGSSRHFNSVTVDPKSLMVKKSGPIEKIELEKNWFTNLPVELQKYLPEYNLTETSGTYEVEYLTSIPSNEMWISENNDGSYWLGLVEQMHNLNRDMHKDLKISTKDKIMVKQLKKVVYFDKFHERIQNFLKLHRGIFDGNFTINQKSFPDLDYILQHVNQVIEKIINLDSWTIIHGDLCFSNIIFDRRKDKLNLIDPRGSFGVKGIYGDPIYDLAKLSHSINGNYDYFTSDLFYFSNSSNSFELQVGAPSDKLISREIFKEFLHQACHNYGITKEELRIIEASLFMSAAPLHPEGNRGKALFLNGLSIVKEVMN